MMKKLVLVLDDDASMLTSLERLLRVNGFEVEVFETVAPLLLSSNLSRATCLVLDINLKEMSGIELKHRLTLMGISIPVIFITGVDIDATRKAALAAGCVAFLPKPFPSTSLIKAVMSAQASFVSV